MSQALYIYLCVCECKNFLSLFTHLLLFYKNQDHISLIFWIMEDQGWRGFQNPKVSFNQQPTTSSTVDRSQAVGRPLACLFLSNLALVASVDRLSVTDQPLVPIFLYSVRSCWVGQPSLISVNYLCSEISPQAARVTTVDHWGRNGRPSPVDRWFPI